MKVKEIIKALGRIGPDEECRLRFYEHLTEKTIVITGLEAKGEGILIHGDIQMVLHHPINEHQKFIVQTVVKNIQEGGEIDQAIRERRA